MVRWLAMVLTAVGCYAQLATQPVVTYRGVVNAASLAPPGLPNAGIARGSVFTIFGTNIGPTAPATVNAFPLTPILNGVSVSISQGGLSIAAIPIFVSANQINAILPSSTPLGINALRVSFGSRLSAPVPIEVVENAPGIFAVSSGGFGPGVVQNFVTQSEQPVNSLDVAAARGQVITIWATGLGRVPFPDNVAPTAQNVDVAVSVTIGERDAIPLYAGRSPCCAGVDQIVVRVPEDTPLGCYVPVRIKAGRVVSNTVTMAVANTAGSRCSDAHNPFTNLMRNSRRQGMVLLDRTINLIDTHITSVEQNTTEAVKAYFWNREPGPFVFDPNFSLPPPGTCTLQQTNGNVLRGAPLRGVASATSALDAGASLRLTTPSNGTVEIGRVSAPATGYAAMVGSNRPSDGVGIPKLDTPPNVRISYSGAIGETSVTPNAANLFSWPNRQFTERVRRDVITRIAYTATDANPQYVLSLVAYASIPNASSAITCVAASGSGQFVLSPDLLANLPVSYGRPDGSIAMLGVGNMPLLQAVPFSSPGLDGGLLLFSQWQTRTVYIQ